MPPLSLVLFDDPVALDWAPFSLTRPAGELLFGTMTLRARIEQIFGTRCGVYLTAAHLQGFAEQGAPPVAGFGDAPTDGDRLFLSSRVVPDWAERRGDEPRELREGPVGCAGATVGWFAPAGSAGPPDGFFADPAATPPTGANELRGRVLDHVWDLMCENADQVGADVREHFPTPSEPRLPAGAYHWGSHPLIIDETARVEPGAYFDTTEGPIWLDRGSVVRALTRLCGPAYIGPDSHVLGGQIDCVSVGPVCKVRGELTSSIVAGYSNKQHEGHIGHAYLGRWVNLGAGTNNSDLKNNYGTIRIWTPRGDTDTGEIKLGCLIGDHVKTGIGLLINTGTVIGAGSNLWGAVLPPKYVPPFSWGSGEDLTEYRVDKFLEVAERAMARRNVPLAPSVRAQLELAFQNRGSPVEPGAAAGG